MKAIYTYGGKPEQRKLTVHDLVQNKGKRRYSQVTAANFEEGQAAECAGIDVLSCSIGEYAEVRRGAPHTLIITALPPVDYISDTEILRAALRALEAGSDAIYSTRGLPVVELLAKNGVPIMSHLGLLPRKSTMFGGIRPVGKRASEAFELFRDFQRMQNAGAFGIEVELVPDEAMEEITARTELVIFSIGAGASADVILLYMEDVLGETESVPRHAKQYGKLQELYRKVQQARVEALRAFKGEVDMGLFSARSHSISMKAYELEKFRTLLSQAEANGK
jgi:3-methyl-2-oxobutanoate hydroxymethyltransferase